jgi:hypothetical protein
MQAIPKAGRLQWSLTERRTMPDEKPAVALPMPKISGTATVIPPKAVEEDEEESG